MSVELDDIVDVEAEYEEFLSQRPPLLRGRSNELENDDIEDDEQEQEQEEEGGEEGGGEEEAEDEMMAAAHQPNTQQKSNKVLVASRVVSLASSSPHSYTKEVLFGIAELVSQYMDVLVADLDAFSDHAKRKQINQADVLLCARRNPDLVARLNRELTTSVSTAKKRAKKSSNNNNDEEA